MRIRDYCPDHPDIRSAMRTGYGTNFREEDEVCYCEECGKALGENNPVYEDYDHYVLCEDCLLMLHLKDCY